MIDGMPGWMGNIHVLLPHHYCWVIVTVLSILCGAVIGVERGKRQKAAGLRTMMLICLGASIFTQGSLLIAGDHADPGRIAAQVVTGVGFLGAGAIIHGRGAITGFTTAAAIWVVAAIGVILGSGYAAAGSFFTLLVVATLLAERSIESVLCGRCVWSHTTIALDNCDGRTRWSVREILDEHMVPGGFGAFGTRWRSHHRKCSLLCAPSPTSAIRGATRWALGNHPRPGRGTESRSRDNAGNRIKCGKQQTGIHSDESAEVDGDGTVRGE